MINTIAGFGVVVISYASTFGLVCLRSIYKNFPLPEFLDSIYLNSRILQSIFSYRFGANGSESSFERDAHHLAAICGLQFESIDAHAMDGFSLALHHVYIATDRPNKQHPLLLLPHLLQSSDSFLLDEQADGSGLSTGSLILILLPLALYYSSMLFTTHIPGDKQADLSQ